MRGRERPEHAQLAARAPPRCYASERSRGGEFLRRQPDRAAAAEIERALRRLAVQRERRAHEFALGRGVAFCAQRQSALRRIDYGARVGEHRLGERQREWRTARTRVAREQRIERAEVQARGVDARAQAHAAQLDAVEAPRAQARVRPRQQGALERKIGRCRGAELHARNLRAAQIEAHHAQLCGHAARREFAQREPLRERAALRDRDARSDRKHPQQPCESECERARAARGQPRATRPRLRAGPRSRSLAWVRARRDASARWAPRARQRGSSLRSHSRRLRFDRAACRLPAQAA